MDIKGENFRLIFYHREMRFVIQVRGLDSYFRLMLAWVIFFQGGGLPSDSDDFKAHL